MRLSRRGPAWVLATGWTVRVGNALVAGVCGALMLVQGEWLWLPTLGGLLALAGALYTERWIFRPGEVLESFVGLNLGPLDLGRHRRAPWADLEAVVLSRSDRSPPVARWELGLGRQPAWVLDLRRGRRAAEKLAPQAQALAQSLGVPYREEAAP